MKKQLLFVAFAIFSLIGFGQVPSYVPTNGLVGYWPFNGNANDFSGNGNNGAVNGSSWGIDRFGNLNSSASFQNSASQYISTNIGIQDTLTFSVWYSCETQSRYYPALIDYGNSTSGNTLVTRYMMHLAGQEPSWLNTLTGKAYVQTNIGQNGVVFDSQITTNGQWHNLIAIYVPNDAVYMYVDGAFVGQDALSNSQVYSGSLFFGRDANDNAGDCSGCGRYQGLLDDIGVWNRVLSMQEIQSLYTSSVQTSQCLPAYVPTNGLMGYWPFCGNANDESGNGNNGTVNGATLTADRNGVANAAYSFDGVNDLCNLNTGLSDEFSVSFWTEIDSFQVYGNIGSEIISTFNNNSGPSGFVIRTDAAPNNIISGFWNGAGNEIVSTNGIPTSQWYAITITYGGGILKMYVNGVLVSTVVGTFVQNNQNVYLGGRQIYQSNTPNFFFNGKIDDVGIWNRALTSQEIQNIYLNSLPSTQCLPDYVPTNGLVGYWPFCGNANDESGNGNNGTVYGATLTADRNGTANSAFSFDGVNDWIETTYLGVSGISSRTVSFWFKTDAHTYRQSIFSYGATGFNGSAFRAWTGWNCTSIGFDTDGAAIDFEPSFTASDWSMFTLVFDNNQGLTSGSILFYINGQFVQSICSEVNPGQIINTPSLYGLTFGKYHGGALNFLNGSLDDIGFWNRALTTQEIQNLYTGNQCSVTASITAQGATTICEGQSVVLNANTGEGYTYQWYLNGNAIVGATSSTYTASAAGSYTVYIADANGCSATSNPVSVSVSALPSVSIVGNGTLTLCAGQSIAITANVTGGSNYQWNLNGNSISGATSLTLTIASAGAYTLTVTNSSNCSVVSGTLNVSIANLSQPQIVAGGPTTFCQGSNVVLSTAQDATYSYQWKKDGVNIGGATSSSYTATQSGSYTVTVSNQAGCTATSSVQTITVNPNPTNLVINYQGASSVCQGQSVVLTSSVTGANQYQWYLAGNAVAGANANSYTAFQGGTYTLSASNQFGCSVMSNGLGVTIIPNPQPVITPSINYLAQGQTATFTVTDLNGANQFSWQTNGSNLGWMNLPNNATYSGGSSNTILVANVGLNNHLQPFRVTGFNGNCIGTSQEAIISILDTCITQVTVYDTIQVSVTDTLVIDVPTGLEEPSASGAWLVYPNPTNDELTVDFGQVGLFNNFTFQIFNSLGQIVYTSNVTSQLAVVDVSTWASGTYLISVLNGTGTQVQTKTLIIE